MSGTEEKKQTISAYIITKDEENNIDRAIESVRWMDEIIVLDSGSSDRDTDKDNPLPLTLGFLVILALTLFRRATAPRSAIAASTSTTELLVNRLLFDRDIRNREAWIHRTPAQSQRDETETNQEKG